MARNSFQIEPFAAKKNYMKAIYSFLFVFQVLFTTTCKHYEKKPHTGFNISNLMVSEIDTTLSAGDLGNGILKISFTLHYNSDSIFIPIPLGGKNLLMMPYSKSMNFVLNGEIKNIVGVTDFVYDKIKIEKGKPKRMAILLPKRNYVDTCKFYFELFRTSSVKMDSVGILNLYFDKENKIDYSSVEIAPR